MLISRKIHLQQTTNVLNQTATDHTSSPSSRTTPPSTPRVTCYSKNTENLSRGRWQWAVFVFFLTETYRSRVNKSPFLRTVGYINYYTCVLRLTCVRAQRPRRCTALFFWFKSASTVMRERCQLFACSCRSDLVVVKRGCGSLPHRTTDRARFNQWCP